MDWVFGENEIMKGREHMFELLQNEYEEYREYFKELELIQRQYNQEEAYYFIINKLIRDSIDDKDISVRDVHNLIRAKDFPGRNSYLRGYAGQVPDFVILHNDFEESKGGNQSDKVYGCVEIKPFSKENKKLDRNYIQPIKDLLKNKELVKAVHEELRQKGIKIEFESGQEKEAFIKNYFKEDNNKSIPIDVMGEMFLCNKNGDLCKNESKELIKQKLLKIQKRNDKGFLVLHANGNEYPVELKSKKTKESSPLEKIVFDNEIVFDNGIVCELLKELIGFKKVIFTNGYQWILMQCKEVEYSETNFEKVKDRNGIKVMSLIMVKDFQCESLADFYSEPKDEETFAELQQHNFEQWLHLKLEINRIFKEAKSQNKQGEEKIGNDE